MPLTALTNLRAIPAFILLVGFPKLPGPYAIGRNVQVSAALATLRHYETRFDADPVRASHLIACAYVVRGDTIDNVFYVSWDRGRTWSHTLTVPQSVDPSCTIGPRGIGYAASIHDSLPSGDSYLHVERSLDRGHTWSQAAVPVDSRSVDRAYVTAGTRHLRPLGPHAGQRLPYRDLHPNQWGRDPRWNLRIPFHRTRPDQE